MNLVRRSVILGDMSKGAAAREYGVNRRSVDKIIGSASPPIYVLKSARRTWVLRAFMEKIEEIVPKDKLTAPAKQTHISKPNLLLFSCSTDGKSLAYGWAKDGIVAMSKVAK